MGQDSSVAGQLNLEAELRKCTPAQIERLLMALAGPPADTSGRMPAKKVCTQEYEQY
jgi:hypothetical protein